MMNENVDRNWYSPECEKRDREIAERVLKEMKQLEDEFSKTRIMKEERTEFGVRKRYMRKGKLDFDD